MRIYIAGPYTKGDVVQNVRNAIIEGDKVSQLGHIPFIPHLTLFWHFLVLHEYQFWISYDMEWLKLCDAVLRLGGESPGADKEVEYAMANGMAVYRSISEIPTRST
jgi:hypothetical protein